jgi:hypothetical protein
MDAGETFAQSRPDVRYFNSALDELLIKYVEENDSAITYFGYSYFAEFQDRLDAVPVQNSQGNLVAPNEASIRDGSYEPLSRSIYMNLLNNKQTLKDTRPFVEFGFVSDDLVAVTGYLAFPDKDEITRRLQGAPYNLGDNDSGLSPLAWVGIMVGGVLLVTLSAFWCFRRPNYKTSFSSY